MKSLFVFLLALCLSAPFAVAQNAAAAPQPAAQAAVPSSAGGTIFARA
jgi:hypothetical protein